MMRAVLAAMLLAAACSGNESAKTPGKTSGDPNTTMTSTALQLQITETVAEISGQDLAISPTDARTWAYLRGGWVSVQVGSEAREGVIWGGTRGLGYSADGTRLSAGLTVLDSETGKLAEAPGGPSSFMTGLSRPARGEAIDAYVQELAATCVDPAGSVVMARWRRPRNRQVSLQHAPALRLIAFDHQRNHVADLTADLDPQLDVLALDCSRRWVVALTPFPVVWDRSAGYARVAGDARLPAGASLAIRRDDTAFALAGTTVEPAGTVTVIDPARLAVIARLDATVGAVWSLAFSPDGKRLAVGGTDALAVLDFDGTTLSVAATLPIGAGLVTALAFEPDGQALRVLGGPGMLRIALR